MNSLLTLLRGEFASQQTIVSGSCSTTLLARVLPYQIGSLMQQTLPLGAKLQIRTLKMSETKAKMRLTSFLTLLGVMPSRKVIPARNERHLATAAIMCQYQATVILALPLFSARSEEVQKRKNTNKTCKLYFRIFLSVKKGQATAISIWGIAWLWERASEGHLSAVLQVAGPFLHLWNPEMDQSQEI